MVSEWFRTAGKKLREDGVVSTATAGKAVAMRQVSSVYKPKKRRFVQRIKYGSVAPDPTEVIYINPADIDFVQAPRFHDELDKKGSYIESGDWDLRFSDHDLYFLGAYENQFTNRCLVPYDSYVFHTSCVQHFINDVPWKETRFYRWILENQSKGIRGYDSEEDIKKSLKQIDDLYEKIERNGYKSQVALGDRSNKPQHYDEILINISRNGDLILDDGRHRLSIAKILDINRIPVRVFVRHREWQKKRKQIRKIDSKEKLGEHLSNYLSHPDIQSAHICQFQRPIQLM